MKFLLDGRVVELKGEREGTAKSITTHQLRQLVQTHGVSEFFHLRIEPSLTQTSKLPYPTPEIETLIQQFQHHYLRPVT